MFILDRFEEDRAVFVDDGGNTLILDRSSFPANHEGDAFRLVDNELIFDEDATRRRRKSLRRRFDAITKRKK